MHEQFMQRAFDLARLGIGRVSPNPAVGAVLVHQGRIIGEGYHRAYGQAHAEVNALADVSAADRKWIAHATLYVTLEPCSIHGNTPPCTDLILRHRIPKVVISQIDKTAGVNGTGVSLLREAGVEVITGILSEPGRIYSEVRNTFVSKERPYILLKWAQTQDGFFAPPDRSPFWITNEFTNRLVHKWRGETDAILVGTTTAAQDDPSLTTRLYPGKNPLRLVIDRQGRLPLHLKLFNGESPTLIFQQDAGNRSDGATSVPIDFTSHWAEALLQNLFTQKIAHLTVEGGVALLRHFIALDLWDEARVLIGEKQLRNGISPPKLPVDPDQIMGLAGDQVHWYRK